MSSCFTQADQIIVRGCFHNESGLNLRAFTRLCTFDGCNNEPFISRSQLKCATCNAQGCQKELIECQHNVLLFRKDFCYSMWSTVGGNVHYLIKGCLFEAEERIQRECNPMDSHRDNCVTCQHDGCNKSLEPPTSTKCMSTVVKAGVDCRSYKSSTRNGCFARDNYGKLELGCNTQRSEEDFQECANVANATCQLCMTEMCNNVQQSE